MSSFRCCGARPARPDSRVGMMPGRRGHRELVGESSAPPRVRSRRIQRAAIGSRGSRRMLRFAPTCYRRPSGLWKSGPAVAFAFGRRSSPSRAALDRAGAHEPGHADIGLGPNRVSRQRAIGCPRRPAGNGGSTHWQPVERGRGSRPPSPERGRCRTPAARRAKSPGPVPPLVSRAITRAMSGRLPSLRTSLSAFAVFP